jgi:glutamyl-tRNA synthetase
MTVRTRFAPSPTGYLHIGGVRTALFNWLLAKQAGGQFILRIDDTDQQRNQEEALAPILDGFRWLGIDWDEGPEVGGPHQPYFQSQRLTKYQDAAAKLMQAGLAYRDYATTEEMTAEREAAEKAKTDFVYSRKWMAETDEQAAAFEAQGRSFVVRLKMHRAAKCEFNDLVVGDVSIDWSTEADHAIQRADGTCLYHLANVVDDAEFEITHVIRGIEHLSNTPRQIFIAQGLGYTLPKYAHLPYVAEPGSKKKLSKRKIAEYLNNKDFKRLYQSGADVAERIGLETDPATFSPVLVDFYKKIGFVPDAVNNYLLLLGWSLDDKTEMFSREQMLEHFSLERVVKSAASFDPQKLQAFQGRYMDDVPLKRKTKLCKSYLEQANVTDDPMDCDHLAMMKDIIAAAGDRLSMAGDILKFDDFFTPDDQLSYNEKAWQKRMVKPEQAGFLIGELYKVLNVHPEFVATELETAIKGFCETQGIKIGDIIHALRVAVTGKAAGFGMFDTLEILGRDRVLNRMALSLDRLSDEQKSDSAV